MSSHCDTEVGSEVLERACGHVGRFAHYARDPYREGRRAKFLRGRCEACGRAANAAHNAAQAAGPPKSKSGRAVKSLPAGSGISLFLRADGKWAGTLTAGGVTVTAESAGLMGISSTLAERWAKARKSEPVA